MEEKKNKKENERRRTIPIRQDIHAALKKYCSEQLRGANISNIADDAIKEYLGAKGIFLP